MNVATIRQHLMDWRAPLISLVVAAATGCQSVERAAAAPTPDPALASRSACQKADYMWNDKITPSRYAQLPALTSPGLLDVLKLITGHFSLKALTTQGDELEPLLGCFRKSHGFGSAPRVMHDTKAHDAPDRSPHQIQNTVAHDDIALAIDRTGAVGGHRSSRRARSW